MYTCQVAWTTTCTPESLVLWCLAVSSLPCLPAAANLAAVNTACVQCIHIVCTAICPGASVVACPNVYFVKADCRKFLEQPTRAASPAPDAKTQLANTDKPLSSLLLLQRSWQNHTVLACVPVWSHSAQTPASMCYKASF